jgi:RHS repeat-associated protein
VWQGLRMVQEVREGGATSSYVYSPDAPYTPMARVDSCVTEAAAGRAPPMQVFHFHTDALGVPQEVTDDRGELAWAGEYQAWGKVQRQVDGADLMPRIDQPLRLPGQYADDSTGLHYNTFRYYDPDVGRFISQDPIGLVGGENLYGYAPNPMGWADPLGLVRTPGHFLEWMWQRPSTGQHLEGIEFSGSDSHRPGRLTFSQQLDVHTEAKVLNKLEHAIQPGDKLYFRGTKDPCNPGGRGCTGRMSGFAQKHGVAITYENKTTGRVFKFGC